MKSALIFFLSSLLPLCASSHLLEVGHETHGHQTIAWNGSFSIKDGKDLVFSGSSFLKDRKIPYQSFSAGARSALGEKSQFGSHVFFDMKRLKPACFGTSFELLMPLANLSLNCYIPTVSGYKPTVELIGSIPVHNHNSVSLGARYTKSKGVQGLFGLNSNPFSCRFGDLNVGFSGAFGAKTKIHKTLSGSIAFAVPLSGVKVKKLSRVQVFNLPRFRKPSKQTEKPEGSINQPSMDSGFSVPTKAALAGALTFAAYFAKWYYSWPSVGLEYPDGPPSPQIKWPGHIPE